MIIGSIVLLNILNAHKPLDTSKWRQKTYKGSNKLIHENVCIKPHNSPGDVEVETN